MAEQLYGIRKYLNDNGYSDDKIGYGNGNVTLNGRNFMSATPQQQDDPTMGLYKDSTYAPQTALSSALSQYRTTDRNNTLNSTVDNMSNTVNAQPFQFKQSQQPFSYNKDNDQAYQSALQSALQNATTASNNAMVGLGNRGIANSSIAVDRANQIQQREAGNVTRDVLPNLIQQAYQRYQDQNNNDYRNQAANYGVGQDQIRNQTALSNFLNGMNQQETDNQYRDRAFGEQQKQNNYDAYAKSVALTGNVGTGPKEDYRLLGGSDGPLSLAGRAQQNNDTQLNAQLTGKMPDGTPTTAEEQRLLGNEWKRAEELGTIGEKLGSLYNLPANTPTQAAKVQAAQIAISQQNANTSAFSASTSAANSSRSSSNAEAAQALAKAKFDYEKDPNNPDNILKLAQAAKAAVGPEAPKLTETAKKNANYAEMVSVLDQLDPAGMKNFFSQEKQNILRDLGPEGYDRLYGNYYSKFKNLK